MFHILFYLFLVVHFAFNGGFNTTQTKVLATKSMSLNQRYPVESVNAVFKQNILLTIAYMQQKNTTHVPDATTVDKPLHYAFTLRKQEVFAFHDAVLPSYRGKVAVTTNAHFNAKEGFKSDGYLVGDGVCHLASLMRFAAKQAGLTVDAPTSHDFANIPQVPKEYGVAIYTTPSQPQVSASQNLYITNSLSNDVTVVLDYHDEVLTVSIVKQTG